MVLPQEDALLLMLLRFPEEVVSLEEYNIPEGDAAKWNITPKEMEMATTLLESMAERVQPGRLQGRIQGAPDRGDQEAPEAEGRDDDGRGRERPAHEATTNVVDFMSLLKKSLEKKGESPRKPATARKASKKPATKKAPAKSTTTKSKKSA